MALQITRYFLILSTKHTLLLKIFDNLRLSFNILTFV